MAVGLRPSFRNGRWYYSIDLSLAAKLRDWKSIGGSILNEDEARRRVRINKNL